MHLAVDTKCTWLKRKSRYVTGGGRLLICCRQRQRTHSHVSQAAAVSSQAPGLHVASAKPAGYTMSANYFSYQIALCGGLIYVKGFDPFS